ALPVLDRNGDQRFAGERALRGEFEPELPREAGDADRREADRGLYVVAASGRRGARTDRERVVPERVRVRRGWRRGEQQVAGGVSGGGRGVEDVPGDRVAVEVHDVELVSADAVAREVGVVGQRDEALSHEETRGLHIATPGDLPQSPCVGLLYAGEREGERAVSGGTVVERVAGADEARPLIGERQRRLVAIAVRGGIRTVREGGKARVAERCGEDGAARRAGGAGKVGGEGLEDHEAVVVRGVRMHAVGVPGRQLDHL